MHPLRSTGRRSAAARALPRPQFERWRRLLAKRLTAAPCSILRWPLFDKYCATESGTEQTKSNQLLMFVAAGDGHHNTGASNYASLWGGAMLFSSSLERPTCSPCGIRMMLARISPDGPQYEYWQYECPRCDRVRTEQRPVPMDPMKTANGWLSGELRPPK